MSPISSRARVALERIEQLDVQLEPVLASHERELSATAPGVALRQATHRYRREDDERMFVLGPVDLTLRGGEIVS